MLVIELIGGLGNQMFQYASAFAIAKQSSQQLLIDNSWFDRVDKPDVIRTYELDCFDLSTPLIDYQKLQALQNHSLVNKLLGRKLANYNEPHFHYDNSLANQRNKILHGYFQSYKYFDRYRSEILAEFTFVNAKNYSKLQKTAQIIEVSTTISVHIRRGDYVTNPKANQTHGLLDYDYYQKAIDYIIEDNTNVQLLVFSDDIDWCRNNLKFKYKTQFVDIEDISWGDMYLMSLCSHNIIANSSYSWWGAWLNQNPDKIVVAPSNWFKDSNNNTKDLLPHEWIKI